MHILRTNDSVNKIMILAVLVSGLAFGGCVSVPKYPDNWPALKKTENKCTVLTGTYSDVGESVPSQESGEAVSCFRTLFPDSEIEPTTVIDKITFKGPESGVLEITAWRCHTPIMTRYLKESPEGGLMCYNNLYLCSHNGWVLVNSCSGGGGAPAIPTPILFAGGHDNLLYSDEDGSLVLKRIELIVVLPWWFRYIHRWYRFRPINQDEDLE